MFTNFKRVFKFALSDFNRNQGRGIAAIFVLILTILLVTGVFLLHGISDEVISQIQNKIDITAYFKSDAAEQDILMTKDTLLKSDLGIQNIQYVSKDDALTAFTEKHRDNSVFSNALNQVGENPFLPSLNIATTDASASQYEKIAQVLEGEQFASFIDSVDFSLKKDTIDKVSAITTNINQGGIVLAVIFIIVAILIVFNTVKLSIDNAKDEISTMRIVGASSWFVRAPFIIQGILFGCIAFVICFFISLLVSFLLAGSLAVLVSGFNLFDYFLAHIWLIMLMQLGLGVGLGVGASFIVVQRYLKV